MAIGPEARRTTSGRVVVVVASYAILGVSSAALGLGPFVRQSDPTTRVIALVTIAAGGFMLLGAVGLIIGGRWGRRAGVVGGWALAVVGAIVTFATLSAIEDCDGSREAGGCSIILGGLGTIGIVLILGGVAGSTIARRARLGVARGRRSGG